MAHGDITRLDIPVADLVRSTTFYNGIFGWGIEELPGFEGYPMWRAPNGISGGGLSPREEGFTVLRSYVEVESIDDTLARVVELGGRVKAPKREIDPTSWWASIEDLDGNEIGIYESSIARE